MGVLLSYQITIPVGAVEALVLIVDGLVDPVVEKFHIRILRDGIDCPVRAPVPYNEPFKRVDRSLGVVAERPQSESLLVPLMDLVGQEGCVDAGIGFSRDEQVIVKELGEAPEEVSQSGEGVLRLRVVSEDQVILGLSVGEANTCRALNVEDIGSHVPRPRVLNDCRCIILDHIWSVLLDESEHR